MERSGHWRLCIRESWFPQWEGSLKATESTPSTELWTQTAGLSVLCSNGKRKAVLAPMQAHCEVWSNCQICQETSSHFLHAFLSCYGFCQFSFSKVFINKYFILFTQFKVISYFLRFLYIFNFYYFILSYITFWLSSSPLFGASPTNSPVPEIHSSSFKNKSRPLRNIYWTWYSKLQ